MHHKAHNHLGHNYSCSGTSTTHVAPLNKNPFYPFPSPDPNFPTPKSTPSHLQVNIVQATQTQWGRFYAQQNVPNPPNKNNINAKNKMRKGITKGKTKGIKGNLLISLIMLWETRTLQTKVRTPMHHPIKERTLNFGLAILVLFAVYMGITLMISHSSHNLFH